MTYQVLLKMLRSVCMQMTQCCTPPQNKSQHLSKRLNDDLSNVNKWLIENKLSPNVDKSEVMIISTRHKLSSIDYNNINVNVNGVRLQNVNKCKHLGIIIDDKLTWRDQVDKVRKKSTCWNLYVAQSKILDSAPYINHAV